MLNHLDKNITRPLRSEGRRLKAICAVVAALAACNSPCKVDADCGTGGACSLLGNGCLGVAFRQSDWSDLSAWTFDGGGTYSVDGGALELVGSGNFWMRAHHAVDGGLGLEVVTTFAYYPAAGGEVAVGAAGVEPNGGSTSFDGLIGPLSTNIEYRLAMRFADAVTYELRRTSDGALINFSTGANPGAEPGWALEARSISYGVKGPARLELRSIVAAGP